MRQEPSTLIKATIVNATTLIIRTENYDYVFQRHPNGQDWTKGYIIEHKGTTATEEPPYYYPLWFTGSEYEPNSPDPSYDPEEQNEELITGETGCGCPNVKKAYKSDGQVSDVSSNPCWCNPPPPNPCDQVNALVTETANATYMQKVKDLATSQNLNLGYEKSVALIDGATPDIIEASGTTASASVQLPDLPAGQKYKTFTHTHPNSPGGTYSVFSFGDLRRMSMLSHSGQLDANQFVAFLPTYKGTYYALTISDVSKFQDFYYYFNYAGNASQGNMMKWLESYNKAKGIEDKYFNDPKNPLIKETDTDNANVFSKFLDFMKEADLGVTLFETNANFDSFTKVEKDQNGTIQRTNCN